MEDKIKSARQTAILLILLLVFTFNLNSTFKENIEKYNVLWSFWIFEALKEDSKVIPKVEPDDSIYSYQDVKKNLSNLQQNPTASEILQTVGWTVDTLKKDSLLKVTLDWSYIDFRLYTPSDFVKGNSGNNYTSLFIFSSDPEIDRVVFIESKSEVLVSYDTIPIDEKEFSAFFDELRRTISNFQIISPRDKWKRAEFVEGKANSFFHVNYGLDIQDLRLITLDTVRQLFKGEVSLPVFNVSMEIEKAYLYILALVAILLTYLNNQLRLINASIQRTEFERFSLTSWKVYSPINSVVRKTSQMIEAVCAIVGYVSATLTPLVVLFFLWHFNDIVGEYEFHFIPATLSVLFLVLITFLALTNVLQLVRKPFAKEES
ncbi:hypothetical protein [Alteromonas mediterranea]|uniref:hypothetical protein n=1 Tax=Alteromonas mediterranea TaxID=314275 RepID=UPI00035579C9|nr:hypothetical protein [Alteromonas mediterranea]AGP85796.1 hypothetical protein I607_10005 [Alteromonas mediterranea U4]AGP89923.1 hypothetical protein I876_10320 [Alteromonas mediterranea U7]AGP94532.1 hypothetical protein I634_14185 [Alteromonas mediterranea U8]